MTELQGSNNKYFFIILLIKSYSNIRPQKLNFIDEYFPTSFEKQFVVLPQARLTLKQYEEEVSSDKNTSLKTFIIIIVVRDMTKLSDGWLEAC